MCIRDRVVYILVPLNCSLLLLTKTFAELNVSSDCFCLDAFTYQISRLWGIEIVEALRFSMSFLWNDPQPYKIAIKNIGGLAQNRSTEVHEDQK